MKRGGRFERGENEPHRQQANRESLMDTGRAKMARKELNVTCVISGLYSTRNK